MARSFEVEAMVRVTTDTRGSGTLILQLRDVSWVNISRFASLPRKSRKYYPSKITRYTVREWVQSDYYSEITEKNMKTLGQVIQMLLDTGWKLYKLCVIFLKLCVIHALYTKCEL